MKIPLPVGLLAKAGKFLLRIGEREAEKAATEEIAKRLGEDSPQPTKRKPR